jgi:enoyl-CoA hydratase
MTTTDPELTMAAIDTPCEHVRVITLNDPETLNAMSFNLVGSLCAALKTVGDDNDCWAVVLTGAGRGFCSGMNMDEVGAPPNINGLTLGRIAIRAMEHMSNVVPAMRAIPQPVIAAVNGPAAGGGMCLALGADVRIVADSATFRAAGINNGLSGVELGASYLLPRLIGASRSNEIILSGRKVDAKEAERIGLASRVVPDGKALEAAIELAQTICSHSTFGVEMTKAVLWDSLECGSLQAAIDLENRNQLMVRMLTRNMEEAIAARKERRPPVFKD